MQPAFVLQDPRHSRPAGSRADGVEGELKQRAGEGPLRSDGDDAAPARTGRAHAQLTPSRGACGRLRPRGPRGPPPRQRTPKKKHNEVAARRARKLGVGVATLTPRCLLEGEAGLTISSWPRLAGAPHAKGKLLQTISIRRASGTGVGRFMSARRTLRAPGPCGSLKWEGAVCEPACDRRSAWRTATRMEDDGSSTRSR